MDTDAVAWIADLPNLRNDQLANPAKEYFIMWDCWNNNPQLPNYDKFRDINENPTLQAQLGHWRWQIKDPITTFSLRTQTVIPAEQGWRGIPSAADNRVIQTNANLPWVPNWDFESGSGPWTTTQNSTMTRICSDGAVGPCYAFVAPAWTGSPYWPSEIKQTFKIPSFTTNGQVLSGSKTSYTVNGRFRCPTWSPSYYNNGASTCAFSIGFRPLNSSVVEKKVIQIPADGQWYFKQTPIDWSWGAHSSDDDIEIIVDTRHYGIDVDGVWVSSGL